MLKEILENLKINEEYKINNIKNKKIKKFIKDRMKGETNVGIIQENIARGIIITKLLDEISAECGLKSSKELNFEIDRLGDLRISVKNDTKGITIVLHIGEAYSDLKILKYTIMLDEYDEEGYIEDTEFIDLSIEKDYNVVTNANAIYNIILDKIIKFCKK